MAESEPYQPFDSQPPSADEVAARARAYRERMGSRRTVREFSDRPVPRAAIEDCLRVATSAPSGANQQPWTFVAVSDPAVRQRIREAAEEEERAFYEHRAPEAWLNALEPFGTDAHKPFIETAPWLVAIFAHRYGFNSEGDRKKHYYVTESVGIAAGMLISAIHLAGLVCLTHTPSPMGFLNRILGRPDHEKPFLLLVVGYPAASARVPVISRKPLEESVFFFEA